MLHERNFYQGRRVLVTGHTGFKGTWLCWLLAALGAEVYGLSLAPKSECLYEKARPPIAGEILSDIREHTGVKRALEQFQPDIIFHLAAHSYINGSYEYPADIFEINVMGTVRLLEAIRLSGKRVPVVVVTSDKCYSQELKGKLCRETDPFGAAEAYSTSKACQDLVAQSYQISFPEVCVATARASNTIGGGDFNQTRLIPHLLDCFSYGRLAKLRNPNFVRPWQYVLDVLCGYLILGEALSQGKLVGNTSFNFGPASDGFQTVGWIAEQLAAHFPGSEYVFQQDKDAVQREILRLDSSRARSDLDWMPVFSLKEALAQTADFFKNDQSKSIKALCRDAVELYITRIDKVNVGSEKNESGAAGSKKPN